MSARLAIVAALAGLAFAIVAVLLVARWATSPVLPTPPVRGPLPASTAPPAPLTSIPLTARPPYGWGPR